MLPRRGLRHLLILLPVVIICAWPVLAAAHAERHTRFPDGTGTVPVYRNTGPHLVVCKDDAADFEKRISGFSSALQESNRRLFAECAESGYRDLQAAVDHAAAGTIIYVLPGRYLEEPSFAPEAASCYHLPAARAPAGHQILTYEQQQACPRQQNLVGIFGIRDLQIEGTGAAPSDVVFDAQWRKLNVIRGDRTSGLYLRNFTAQRSTFNAVYLLEADGFVVDRVIGRWNTEYGFLSFAADHGLFTGCEAYGNGDSGIYPGGNSDINKDRGLDVRRYAIEVKGCHSHDNTLGYSGTGGDSAWVHDNEFDHNMGGASMDSLFPNHPGLPQNHALFEHNLIHANNSNYYPLVRDGTCAKPVASRGIERGVVCPAVPVPAGSGVLVIGGDYNVFRENWVYDNWKVGFVQVWVPGLVRDNYTAATQEETSNFNRYLGNHMGRDVQGASLPNGFDFFWDGQGAGNCWETAAGDRSEPLAVPGCPSSAGRLLADPAKLLLFVDCAGYDLVARTLPAGCDWFDSPQRPGRLAASITVQSIAPTLQLIAVPILFVLLSRGRRSRRATATTGAALLGSVLLLAGSAEQFWYLAAPGIAILGLAWLAAARLVGGTALGLIAALLGVTAVLEAVDSGLLLLPLPVGPVWFRVGLELIWVVLALLSLRRPGRSRFRKPVAVS